MYRGRRRVRKEFVVAIIITNGLILVLVAGSWLDNWMAVWIVVALLGILLAFSGYRCIISRRSVWLLIKRIGHRMVFNNAPPSREPLPSRLRIGIMERANYLCENPDCGYRGKPVIHHINMNNSHNSVFNLIALCPNCHQEAHWGNLTCSQLRNWVNKDYRQLKLRQSLLT